MAALSLTIVMLIASACNLPVNLAAESDAPVGKDARTYRMYSDSSSDESTIESEQ